MTSCDWSTWQLLDSLLPTGGFAHSYGLECAVQSGLVVGPTGLAQFVASALENCGSLMLPFVHAAHTSATPTAIPPPPASSTATGDAVTGGDTTVMSEDGEGSQGGGDNAGDRAVATAAGGVVCRWVAMDAILSAMLSNHVAARASVAQGTALLRLAAALYPHLPAVTGMQEYVKRNRRRKGRESRKQRIGRSGSGRGVAVASPAALEEEEEEEGGVCVHHAPVFGTLCGALGLPALTTQRAYMFLTLRDLMSAATRLNVIGPMQAAVLQSRLAVQAEALLRVWYNRPLRDACGTAPVLDIVQGSHDVLFARLFSS